MEKRPAANGEQQLIGTLLPRCTICKQVPERGIAGGIRIKKSFICNGCEGRITSMEIGSPLYVEFLNIIKRIIK